MHFGALETGPFLEQVLFQGGFAWLSRVASAQRGEGCAGRGQRPRGAQLDPAHLLGIRAGPVQEQRVEHILPPDEEPVAVLIQVEGAESQEASVAKEENGAVGPQKFCRRGRKAPRGVIPAPKTCRAL